MNDRQRTIADMLKLASGIDTNVLNCLLLIKYICTTSNKEQYWDIEIKYNSKKILWDMIAQESYKKDGHIFGAIRYAVEKLSSKLLFTENILEHICNAVVDEHLLGDYVRLLSNIETDSDVFSLVFEKNLSRKVWRNSSRSGDFYTPSKVVRWMVEILGIEHDGKVYDPCCGSGAMLCGAALSHPDKRLQLYGQTLDKESFSICQTNLMLRGLSVDLGKHPANTLLDDMHANQQFDFILSNPPYNSSDWYENSSLNGDIRWKYGYPPRKNANFAWIQHIISHLSSNGRAIVLLPNSTLTTNNLAECEIRQNILHDGWIEAIVTFPQGLFYGTKVPCCAWIINQDIERDKLLFVDARQLDIFNQQDGKKISDILYRYRNGERFEMTEWYAVASHTKIAQMKYILSPNLYTCQKELTVPLFEQLSEEFNALADTLCSRISQSSLCKDIQKWKTQSIPTDWNEICLSKQYNIFGGVCAKKDAFGRGIPMVDVRTVIHNIFLPDAFSSSVEISGAEKYYIRCGDILMNRTSETIDELACCSVALKEHAAVYGSYLKRLRPIEDNRIEPRYIAGYFCSRIYRQEIERVSFVYTTRVNINLHQLSMLRLYYPNMEWQHIIGEMLSSVIHFKQGSQDAGLDGLIDRFIEVLIEKFITYPILLFQKGSDQQ